MRIDYDYIKEFLEVFLDSESSTVDYNSFEILRGNNEDKFIFHIEIMSDKNIFTGAMSDGDIGISRDFSEPQFSIVPWRLTAEGHDFASSITKPDVLQTIKDKFKEEGISVVVDIVKKIASRKANELLD